MRRVICFRSSLIHAPASRGMGMCGTREPRWRFYAKVYAFRLAHLPGPFAPRERSHPFGMRNHLGIFTGGGAALNGAPLHHRLIFSHPFGMRTQR